MLLSGRFCIVLCAQKRGEKRVRNAHQSVSSITPLENNACVPQAIKPAAYLKYNVSTLLSRCLKNWLYI